MIRSSATHWRSCVARANQNSCLSAFLPADRKRSIEPHKQWPFSKAASFCIPEDIKPLVVPVFAHRIVVNGLYASTLRKSEQSDQVLKEIIENVAVPV